MKHQKCDTMRRYR